MAGTRKVMLFVESNTSGTGRLMLQAARTRGYEPVLLAADVARYRFAAEDGIGVVQADTTDAAAIVTLFRERSWRSRLAGVLSTSEYFIAVASEVAARLDLPGPAIAAVRAARDKDSQHRRLSAAGVPVPAGTVVRRVDEIERVASRLHFPVVAKPTMGSGSTGARLCVGVEELQEHVTRLLAARANERGLPVPSEALLQEYIDGPQYSVETLGLQVVGITANHIGPPPCFVEVGHEHPAELDPIAARQLRTVARRALAALGLTWGPAHVELRMAAGGPRVIEVNARLAGGWIPELVRLSSGVDLIAGIVDLSAGHPLRIRRRHRRIACIRFLVADRDGVITAVTGADGTAMADGVVDVRLYKHVGEDVRCFGDFRDRIGHAISVAENPLAAIAAAEQALKCLSVRVESTK